MTDQTTTPDATAPTAPAQEAPPPQAEAPPKAPPFRLQFEKPMQTFEKVQPAVLLRTCQSEAILAWKDSQKNRKVICLPTGCGKTVTALSIAADQSVGRTLWIAHRDELIRQPLVEVDRSFPGMDPTVVKAHEDGFYGRIVFASIQTLAKRSRLSRLGKESPFSLVVCDEAHHVVARSYMNVLEALGCFDKEGPELLGLTATPRRSDKASLSSVFEEVVYALSIAEAIEAGYLVQPVPRKVPLAIDAGEIRVRRRADGEQDFDEDDLARALKKAEAAKATALAIKEHAAGRKTVVFTVTVEQAQMTVKELVALGVTAEWVSGDPHMKLKARRDATARFREGKFSVIVNASLLTEGYDDPSIDCVVIAKPTKSTSTYIQAVGRGLRLFPGKKDCLVIDIVSASDLGMVTISAYLESAKKDSGRVKKPRAREPRDPDRVRDPDAEWRMVKSYLRSARVDLVHHGDVAFARVSDSLLTTITKDGEYLLVRRADDEMDHWVVERKGARYTLVPTDVHSAMDVAATICRECGGTAQPGSKTWNDATERPVPPPVA